jgi:hypothetical protein
LIEEKPDVKLLNDFIGTINASLISSWRKEELRNRVITLKRNLDNLEKMGKLEIVNSVVEEVKGLVELDGQYLVKVLNAGGNLKALDAALKITRGIKPALFFTVEENTGKVFVMAAVDKGGVDKGLKANEWVGGVVEVSI